MKQRFKIFWARLTHWEYWPWQIVYIPIFIYWLWCGLKTKAIFWISAVNPGFPYGGIIGASKKLILDKLPGKYVPKTILVHEKTSTEEILAILEREDISFPLIIKPDIGERGFHVERIDDAAKLTKYLSLTKEEHLLQEYLDMPIELGVFYYRLPGKARGQITSVVRKKLLTVTGDSRSTVRQLMQKDIRALQQLKRLESEAKINLDQVLDQGESLLLEPIGNHVRGTVFLDAGELINEQLLQVFDTLAQQIDGFYYGRFDIRCATIEALYKGDFKVMELNGAASEPAHIYAPNYPIIRGYRELLKHWRILYKISLMNHKNGTQYMSFRTGMWALRKSRFRRS